MTSLFVLLKFAGHVTVRQEHDGYRPTAETAGKRHGEDDEAEKSVENALKRGK